MLSSQSIKSRAEALQFWFLDPFWSHPHFLWLEGLIRREDVLSFRPFLLAPQELHGALPCPVCLFPSLSHFFCMPLLYTSEVCVTGRLVGSFVTVITKSLETVDRESISSVPSPTRGEHISVSQAHSMVSVVARMVPSWSYSVWLHSLYLSLSLHHATSSGIIDSSGFHVLCSLHGLPLKLAHELHIAKVW